jgi:hypothetical protein
MTQNPSLDSEKKSSKNLKEILKGGFEVLNTSGKNIILGKGLLRLVYNPNTDEVDSQYILNK